MGLENPALQAKQRAELERVLRVTPNFFFPPQKGQSRYCFALEESAPGIMSRMSAASLTDLTVSSLYFAIEQFVLCRISHEFRS